MFDWGEDVVVFRPRAGIVVEAFVALLAVAGLVRLILRARRAGQPVGPSLRAWARARAPDFGLAAGVLLAFAVAGGLLSLLGLLVLGVALSSLDGEPDGTGDIDGLVQMILVAVAVAAVLAVVLAVRFVRRVVRQRRADGRGLWPPTAGDVAVVAVAVFGSGMVAVSDAVVPAYSSSCDATATSLGPQPADGWEPVDLPPELDAAAVTARFGVEPPWIDDRSAPCTTVEWSGGGLTLTSSGESRIDGDVLSSQLDAAAARFEAANSGSGLELGGRSVSRFGSERTPYTVSVSVHIPWWWLGACEPVGRRDLCRVLAGGLGWNPDSFPDVEPIHPRPHVLPDGRLVLEHGPVVQHWTSFDALDREKGLHEARLAGGWRREDGLIVPCYFPLVMFDDPCQGPEEEPELPRTLVFLTEVAGVPVRATYLLDDGEAVTLAARVETLVAVP